jgi:hypothetical protein
LSAPGAGLILKGHAALEPGGGRLLYAPHSTGVDATRGADGSGCRCRSGFGLRRRRRSRLSPRRMDRAHERAERNPGHVPSERGQSMDRKYGSHEPPTCARAAAFAWCWRAYQKTPRFAALVANPQVSKISDLQERSQCIEMYRITVDFCAGLTISGINQSNGRFHR